ncbi:MAG: ABC transporter permease subunit [Chloroflexi bacterium]|nr:ABC transporter permease subunit [Chloroflexota bacterium]
MKLALQAMLESIMIGFMATFAGMLLAFPLSFLAARNLMTSLRTSAQGLVGGVFGFAGGAWLGYRIAQAIGQALGGLERAPVTVALVHLVFVLGAAIFGFRTLSRQLDRWSERWPAWLVDGVRYLGFAAIGASIGWVLGLGYAHGILAIAWDPDEVQRAAPGIARVGAVLGALAFMLLAYRWGRHRPVPIGKLIYASTRLVLNVIRSIEPLIWGLVGVVWVGLGPFAGFIALTIHTVAALGKLYSEAIESIHPGPIEAVQSTGANRLQTIMYAVVPQVLPQFTAFSLYRWDINVRMSTVIGLVGGGGIGFLLIQWIRQVQYENAGLAVWLIAITVSILDFVSASIRKRLV